MLTAERLRELLDYDPETGIMTWQVDHRNAPAGSIAGTTTWERYVRIWINGRSYVRSRLAWLYTHGHWPAYQVDHINRNAGDDRLCNLREATQSQNTANRAPWGRSGIKGVEVLPSGKFRVALKVNGKRCYMGVWPTAEIASAVYRNTAKLLHGKYAYVR
jgi:hypothetical protein